MASIIKLKAGHPTGSMLRAGIRVGKNEPVIVDNVPKQLKNDPWFVVEKIADKDIEKAIENGAKDLRVAIGKSDTEKTEVPSGEAEKADKK